MLHLNQGRVVSKMARMIKRVVVVALCCGVSVASADPASEPKVKAIELSPPSLQMPQPSALNALMVPRSDHDIDMLARAIRRSDGSLERTRPLCAYPKVARWSGRGSTDDAANFSCVAADR